MEDVELRRRRLAAMREQADAQTGHDAGGILPSPSAPLLSNPFEDSADAAVAEVKSSNFHFYTDPLAGYSGSKRRKAGVGVLPTPSLPSNVSRHAGAGILPSPPHLQPAGVYSPPGPPSWQPIPYQSPYSNSGFAYPQPPSGWQAGVYQTPYGNPAFAHQQPPAQFQPQFPPHHMNQLSNQISGQGRGGDCRFSGRYNGSQSPISHAGDSRRDGSRGEGRGAHGRGQGGVRVVSAKDQPHLFAKKSMLEDPWQGLETNRMERS